LTLVLAAAAFLILSLVGAFASSFK
jgi:hypothetical protein